MRLITGLLLLQIYRHLVAEARDEHVILSWDNIAESSVDRFLPDSLQNDFEGYKIYRSTDKYFRDAQIITDGYGNPMFYDPIFQCDKIDGIQGLFIMQQFLEQHII